MKKPPSLRQRRIGVVRTDADSFADNTASAIVILELQRREIEKGDLTSAIKLLGVLADTAANVVRYKESLIFQISGYDADPRELAEIPEVRAFFAALAAEWPHWAWFLPRRVGLLALFLSLLCPVSVHRGAKGARGIEFDSPEEALNLCRALLARSTPLIATLGVAPETAEASAASASVELRAVLEGR